MHVVTKGPALPSAQIVQHTALASEPCWILLWEVFKHLQGKLPCSLLYLQQLKLSIAPESLAGVPGSDCAEHADLHS